MVSVEDQSPPQWFRDALAQSGQPGRVDVNGASIAYRSWGEPDTPGVVLIHGGMANQNWWDHIAPFLASGRRVVTLDLAGHGDSDRRSEYRFEEFIDEVLAVASAGRIAGPPILVGHSMGGIVAYAASARCPEQIAGVIVFDSPVRDMTPEERAMRADSTAHPPRIYPTVEAAVAIAEGYTERAKKRFVRLTRKFGGVMSTVMVPTDYPLQPGDTIYVLERFF